MDEAAEQLPEQRIGRETNFTQEHTFADIKLAHAGFKKAAARLLNVNDWHVYTGAGSAKFTLCNNEGKELNGFAAEGLYFSIDLPGPGPDAGGGLEWVMIENVKAEGDEHSAEEYLLLTARPVPDPKKAESAIAHFYSDESTSTFIVRRDGRVVSVGAHGRNESPNNENVDVHDKIRNTAIALMARIGLSGGQWQKLVNGIIDDKDKA